MKTYPPWSCYPDGLQSSRRSFLKALASATAASALACPEPALAQQAGLAAEQPPDVPGAYPEGAVLLNFNENPLGPSPKAVAAILDSRLAGSNRYNNIFPLVEALARHHDVSDKEILVGCGSTEFLHIAPWTFLSARHKLVVPDPTYGWSSAIAQSMGAQVIRVPLDREGRIDTSAFPRAFDNRTRLIYIANPNNPTGASLDFDEVKELARAMPDESVLLVDEAYGQFLPSGESAIDLAREGRPVIVTRTFSKAYGLAGLRLGYAVAPERLIEKLKTYWLWDLGINAAVNVAGPAALADTDHVKQYIQTVRDGLDLLHGGLKKLGLRPLPHRAPFLMVDLGRQAEPVVRALEQRKVFVRDGNAWEMPNYLRVSVGLISENEAFLEALAQVL